MDKRMLVRILDVVTVPIWGLSWSGDTVIVHLVTSSDAQKAQGELTREAFVVSADGQSVTVQMRGRTTMGYIVLPPNNGTNPSGKFRVVLYSDWLQVADSVRDALPDGPSYGDYDSAEKEADRLNREKQESTEGELPC
jgi:hypothetical protein